MGEEKNQDIEKQEETVAPAANKEEKKSESTEEVKVPPKGACLPVGRDQPLAEKAGEEKKAEAPKKEAVKAEAEESKEKKRKKINLMSQKEIEEKLKSVKEKMGNLKSRYAKQLLKQKDILNK